MLCEFNDHRLKGRVGQSQFRGDLEHIQGEKRHPRGAIRLLQITPLWERRTAIKDTDVVEPEEAAFENVLAVPVLAIDPPGEVQSEFVEDALEEADVALAARSPLERIRVECRPGMHRRVYVAEIPFIGRSLTAGMRRDSAGRRRQ